MRVILARSAGYSAAAPTFSNAAVNRVWCNESRTEGVMAVSAISSLDLWQLVLVSPQQPQREEWPDAINGYFAAVAHRREQRVIADRQFEQLHDTGTAIPVLVPAWRFDDELLVLLARYTEVMLLSWRDFRGGSKSRRSRTPSRAGSQVLCRRGRQPLREFLVPCDLLFSLPSIDQAPSGGLIGHGCIVGVQLLDVNLQGQMRVGAGTFLLLSLRSRGQSLDVFKLELQDRPQSLLVHVRRNST